MDPAQNLTPDERDRWMSVGMLAACAMVLGYLETFIPIPIPGVKLGLANIPILIALARGETKGAFCIACLKVAAAGLLFGSPITMAYSAVGTLLAFALMAPLSRLSTMRITMVSVVGALAHEAGQLLVAAAILGTSLVWYSAPLLLVAGIVTGVLCGLVTERVLKLLPEGTPSIAAAVDGEAVALPSRKPPRVKANPRVVLIVFLAFVVVVLHLSTTPALIAALAIGALACVLGRVGLRSVVRALRPLVAMLVITFVAQVASLQAGTVLLELGPVTITAEALSATWIMMARLVSITAASIAVMHLVDSKGLVDAVSWMLSPLKKLGLRLDGFALALDTALRFVPVLAGTLERDFGSTSAKGRRNVFSRAFWRDTFPTFVASLYAE